ncbi:selenoprotein Pb-like isoform X1 [Chiloscyllium plagiosum]|uniref:selenoprotein Pb-like isoform X1 n=1 Tax=Chiloscyllium plagiosum TaxID=36176 RepID=UPI001CB82A8E|nr:selenoprotein Pb-like isoform X1 [Chiloscyllium plagiosum]XP_043554952.1 selenoprotein Pb-like isoform X1 [Chiloscyllium plagiosum]XP_043554953.1 selenoprotein Pb-like isoform X1 [Chiloscyllium plagiosum]
MMVLEMPLLTIVLGLTISVVVAESESRICKVAPHWEIDDHNPMVEQIGHVVVVALLKASCGFCLTQATKLGSLRNKLERQGLKDIHYMIVNEKTPQSRAMLWELKRHTPEEIPVYQQSPFQSDIWSILQGNKDDFLIYDRCGKLTFHIVLPYSYLQFRYTEAAIRATYSKDICGNCGISDIDLETYKENFFQFNTTSFVISPTFENITTQPVQQHVPNKPHPDPKISSSPTTPHHFNSSQDGNLETGNTEGLE